MQNTEAGESRRSPLDPGRLRNQVLVLALLCIVFFHNILFAPADKVTAGYDVLVYHYYAREFTRESLLEGRLPKWNPYEYAGMPFAADPGNCVFYPLNKFFLLMPTSKAIGLNLALHVFLAGLGMLLLSRSVGLKRSAALLSAVAFMFSGYFIDRIGAGHEILVMCSAYLPWIFLFYELASRRGGPKWPLLGGIALGLQILTGASQPVLYTGIFLFVYAVAKNVQAESGTRIKLLTRDLGFLVLMAAAGLGLAAIQLIPSAELLFHSVRARASAEFVGSYSFPPRNFIHLLLPYVNVGRAVSNWEYACYVGVLPLALAITALVCFKDRTLRSFAAVGAVALLIMLGGYTPLFPLLLRVVPGLGLFRIHARAEIGFIMALAIMAGAGWQTVFGGSPDESVAARRRLALISGGFAAIAAVVAILFWLKRISVSVDVPMPSAIFGFLTNRGGAIVSLWHPAIFLPLSAIGIALVATILLVRRCDNQMKYLLAGFIVVDLLVMSAGRIKLTGVAYVTEGSQLIDTIKDDRSEYFRVWFPLKVFFGSRAKFFEVYAVNGHNALGLRLFERYLESLTGVSPVRTPPYYGMDRRVFTRSDAFVDNVLNVKYFWSKAEGQEPIFYRAESFFPRALFLSDYLVRPPQDFLSMEMDPESLVMLHEQPPSGSYGSNASADVTIDSYENDEIELTVSAPTDGFVVLSEVYYPGWRAEVDGVAVKVLRGDFLLRVVPVTRGERKVRLFFAPGSLLLGTLITGVTAVIVVGALFYLRLSRRAPAFLQYHHVEDAEERAQH